ncbi:MAG: hypothetical protein AMXMBFR64_61980 [Myxococcales bacterium]
MRPFSFGHMLRFAVVSCDDVRHIHRGLAQPLTDDSFLRRTPAMAASLAERPLSAEEIASTQVVACTPMLDPARRMLRRRARRDSNCLTASGASDDVLWYGW